jgi:hypothetical protein
MSQSIFDAAQKAQPTKAARVSYGIVIGVGSTTLNEWGLSESEAKLVHAMLTANGDKPLPPTKSGIVYSRRQPSNNASELAQLQAEMAAK